METLTIKEVYQLVYDECQFWNRESDIAKSEGQDDVENSAQEVANAYRKVMAWLERTEEINPTNK